MRIVVEQDFKNRDELDTFVRSRFGDNSEVNKNIVLEIEEENMTALSLSESTTVHGVRVQKIVKAKKGK